MVTGTAPAFAIELPEGWRVGTGAALLQATSPTGDTLVFANDPVPTEATFDEYALRVEKDLETSAGAPLGMSFRQAGTGLIGRIATVVPDPKSLGSPATALFLYPACTDGARTLTITGMPALLPTPPDRGLDTWDVIAAAVDPCAETPAPALVLDPAVVALIDPYIAISTDYASHLVSTVSSSLSVAQKAVKNNVAAAERYIAATTALPWTPELQPLADALVSVIRDKVAVGRKQLVAKTIKAFNALVAQDHQLSLPNLLAANALRLAMGRATVSE